MAVGVFTEREWKMKQKARRSGMSTLYEVIALSGWFPFKERLPLEGCGAGEWRPARYQFRKLHIGEVVEASTATVIADIEHVWGPGIRLTYLI